MPFELVAIEACAGEPGEMGATERPIPPDERRMSTDPPPVRLSPEPAEEEIIWGFLVLSLSLLQAAKTKVRPANKAIAKVLLLRISRLPMLMIQNLALL